MDAIVYHPHPHDSNHKGEKKQEHNTRATSTDGSHSRSSSSHNKKRPCPDAHVESSTSCTSLAVAAVGPTAENKPNNLNTSNTTAAAATAAAAAAAAHNNNNKKKKREGEVHHEFPRPPVVIQVVTMPRTHVDHTYRDFSLVPKEKGYKEPSRIEDMTFAQKVHRILSSPDCAEAMAWLPHGRAFTILRPKRLEDDKILQEYFGHNRYSSFLIQLKKYGLKSITQGKDRGAFYHEFMLRGLPHLCKYMPEYRECRRLVPDPDHEPDFYAIGLHWPVPEAKKALPRVSARSSSPTSSSPMIIAHDVVDTSPAKSVAAVNTGSLSTTTTGTAAVVANAAAMAASVAAGSSSSLLQSLGPPTVPGSSRIPTSLEGVNLAQYSPQALLKLLERPRNNNNMSPPVVANSAATTAASTVDTPSSAAFKAQFLQNNGLNSAGFRVAGSSSVTAAQAAPRDASSWAATLTPVVATSPAPPPPPSHLSGLHELLQQIAGGGVHPVSLSGGLNTSRGHGPGTTALTSSSMSTTTSSQSTTALDTSTVSTTQSKQQFTSDQEAISSLLEQIRQRRLRNALELELILLENQSAENIRAARRNGTPESILNMIQNSVASAGATTTASLLAADPMAASLLQQQQQAGQHMQASARGIAAAEASQPAATRSASLSNAVLAALLNSSRPM